MRAVNFVSQPQAPTLLPPAPVPDYCGWCGVPAGKTVTLTPVIDGNVRVWRCQVCLPEAFFGGRVLPRAHA